MPERWEYLLFEDFDLENALRSDGAERVLRDLGDLAADAEHRWRQAAREGMPPGRFAEWEKTRVGLEAARRVVDKLKMLIANRAY